MICEERKPRVSITIWKAHIREAMVRKDIWLSHHAGIPCNIMSLWFHQPYSRNTFRVSDFAVSVRSYVHCSVCFSSITWFRLAERAWGYEGITGGGRESVWRGLLNNTFCSNLCTSKNGFERETGRWIVWMTGYSFESRIVLKLSRDSHDGSPFRWICWNV